MERFIFGTYKIEPDQLENSIINALIGGIRRFDTAQLYKNEDTTNKYLAKYENVSISTKIRHITNKETTLEFIQKSIDTITSSLHILLLHRPMPIESWNTLNHHKYKYILGVSNYNIENLEYLKKHSDTLPKINQIEFHPFCKDSLEILKWCKNNNIKVQGHTILANTKFFNHPLILDLSNHYNVSPAQIMMKWAYQHGIDLVMSTIEAIHIQEWKTIPTDLFHLSLNHMEKLNNISKKSSYQFYDNSWSPWIWNESASNNNSFLLNAIDKLQEDIKNMNNNQPVSELALLLPSIKDKKVSDIAKNIAETIFPPKMTKNKNILNVNDSYVKYSKCLKNLKNKIYQQRKTFTN